MKQIRILFILALVGIMQLVKANPTFRRVSPEGGITFQAIRDIKKDKYGIMWLSTQNGLFKYDSKNFINYTHRKNDPTSLPDDNLTSILVGQDSTLWIGTENGLCSYHYSHDNFIQHKILPSEKGKSIHGVVSSLAEDQNHQLWVVEQKRLFVKKEEGFEEVKTMQASNFSYICFDNSGWGWLGTFDGSVYQLNPADQKLEKVIPETGNNVTCIFPRGNTILVGYKDGGAWKYSKNGYLLKHFTFSNDKYWDISHTSIRSIAEDSKGRLWLGTFKGLFIEENEQLIRYSPQNTPNLTHTSIFCLYRDNEDVMWVGTWSGGISYCHPKDNNITNYRHKEKAGSLSNNIISSFAQVSSKGIYVGTEVGGLNYLDFESKQFSSYVLNCTTSNSVAYNIKSLASDVNNNLYIGTLNGLFIKKFKEDKFYHIPAGKKDGKHLSAKNVYTICPVDSGVWLGLFGNSVNFYDYKSGTIDYCEEINSHPEFPNNNIRYIAQDKNKNLWLATQNGIVKLKEKQLTHYHTGNSKLSGNVIYHICESSNGEIWLATKSNGISIYNPENNSFRQETFNGLIRFKDVYSIVEDINQEMWVTTNIGLIHYNSSTKEITHITKTDGIQSNLFNPQAIFNDHRGTLYFGGSNGFSLIKPGEITINNKAPEVIVNKILINNTTPLNYFSLLKKNIKAKLKLKHYQTSISIYFSADNYLLPQKNKFKYRLKGLSDKWIENENEGRAVFTNLTDKEYVFEVIACNNDGIWNNKPLQIEIEIATPYWRSVWALLLYALLLLGIGKVIYNFLKEKEKLKKQVLIEKIEHRNKEKLNEAKLQFFTNISHEFRTPLTLITGPLSKLIESDQFGGKSKEYLQVINRNTHRLLALVNQLLDLRKVQKGKSMLTISSIDLNHFIQERFISFQQLAEEKNIRYTFEFPEEKIILEADEDKLDKIIFNLLSNAFKYTANNGEITISAGLHPLKMKNKYANQLSFGQVDTDKLISIIVSDTGKGILSNDLIRIFNRFERAESQSSGSGIGLALCQEYTFIHRGDITAYSTPEQGSSFQIRLPLQQTAQKILTTKTEASFMKENTCPILSHPSETEEKGKKIILIVEDHADLRAFLNDTLSVSYQTLMAPNGKEALKILSTHEVDLIISDIMMPEMDGMEFCNHIKSSLALSHLPVILLTALSETEKQLTGLRHGADAYITKPFDNQYLLARIENLLLQRVRLREKFQQSAQLNQSNDVGGLDNYFLQKLNTLIEKNLVNEDFSIEWLASEIGLSRSQLHRKLKNITDSSTSEYVRLIRLKKATEFLKTNQYNIDEAAYKAGFQSHSYFSKCFKELYDMSPKEYKAKYCK